MAVTGNCSNPTLGTITLSYPGYVQGNGSTAYDSNTLAFAAAKQSANTGWA
jgi:hypothetical protein